MVTRYNLYLSLPIYLRELLTLMINHFQIILERHDKDFTFEVIPDSLLSIKLATFRARQTDEQSMKTFSFGLLPPFNDYMVRINGLEYRPENKEIYFTFNVDLECIMALQQGLNDSTNLAQDIDQFEQRQLLMTLQKWPGNHVLQQLNRVTEKMTLSENFNHTDICAVSASVPFSSPLNTFKLVLENDTLVFLHNQQVMKRNSELMARRRAGRQLVHIPAAAAAVAPVPGTVQERNDELARLNIQLNEISARIQQINPAAQQPIIQPPAAEVVADGPAGGGNQPQDQQGGGAVGGGAGGARCGGGAGLQDRLPNFVHNNVNGPIE